jgi:hypothetical protein
MPKDLNVAYECRITLFISAVMCLSQYVVSVWISSIGALSETHLLFRM